VSYSHAENLSKPLLLPGQPDVEVDAAITALANKMRSEGATQSEIDRATSNARFATQTLEVRDSWAFPTVRLKAPGKSWLVEDIANRLELSYNYSITRYRDVLIQKRREWQWQARIGYGYDFSREAYIQPFKHILGAIPLVDIYKDVKFYYLPSRFNTSAELGRSRTEEDRRNPPETRPYIRSFTHARTGSFAYKLSEDGLLNLDGNYNTSLQTSLLHMETELSRNEFGEIQYDDQNFPVLVQRQSSEIFGDIFFSHGGLYFGIPINYQQQVAINSRPKIPPLFDLDRFIDFNMSYQVTYGWQENLQQAGLGRAARFNANANIQMNFRIKSLFDPLFDFAEDKTDGSSAPASRSMIPGRRGSVPQVDESKTDLLEKQKEVERMQQELKQSQPEQYERMKDQLEKSIADLAKLTGVKSALNPQSPDSLAIPKDSLATESSFPGIGRILGMGAYYLIKIPFLDYENLSITFSENNSSTVTGVRGETGFSTFWSSNILGNPTSADFGPSRLYQLGLVSDPNPASGTIAFKRSFPFIGIDNYQRGLRAGNPNGNYTDNFSQSNNFSIKTNRPLWTGARIDFNWDLRWSTNKNYQLSTDASGVQTITSMTSTGNIERSYLSFPDFLFFSAFNTNVSAVNKRYQELNNEDNLNRRATSEKLAQAFEEGFEAMPWLSKVLSGFLPRVNWGLRWDGIEKIGLIEGFADRISLEHRYSSTISMAYRNSQDDGARIIENKRVGYNFAPLLGLTFNFNKVWNGDVSINSRWGKQRTYDLNTSSNNIVESSTDEISITANYKRTGFDFPLFGLALKNDIDFSIAFSLNKNSSFIYQTSETEVDVNGQPREGTTRISLEPRVRYVVSQRVTASLFYRYQRTKPDSSVGSRIPGTTIHEGGLEIRISITGS